MANTLTSLTPTIYEALDVVSREMVGFIPAVSRNSSAERAALNQSILVPITTAQTAADNTAGVTAPNTGDQTVNNVSMTISKSKHVPIRWNGEEQKGLINAGSYAGILKNQFVQGFRTLVNLIEADLFATTYQSASRAYGTAGTAPFGTAGDLSDIAQVRKILDDNGAPQTDLQFVAGSAAMANLRGKQSVLFKVNEAGSDQLLRDGVIGRLEGFDIHNSNSVAQVTKGTGASYVTSGSTAPGVTSIALVTGSGTVLAGDVVTFTADSVNKYVVNTGVAAAGTIVIGAPGAMVTIATSNALTVGNSYTPNMAFSKSAVQLITRAPAMPVGPNGQAMDMADDVIQVADPNTGLVFDVAVYRQFMQLVYHIRIAWGAQAIKPNHIATLIG
ncbi:P22 coat - protein 5 family protein [Mesorhizobium sp. M2D.F.Ca.ET.145.01.1.1]|uniref:P22 phage major capsid protein family protein n=1 Tax=unclassified Mesorhizobium TaxID=325217 RepID=UPI000FC9E8F5|nr:MULTISPECIES: P22 phage major capsid protein family protein [unclassified Mesorhizobium]TGU44642.1 P22 coat - protein 5 family protein [bacterium M00.F.Ca.ET.146.01.1.1]TGU58470.1 P22 coat - protein 5 family protein [Mesorhizobium sp. M2D.F.Ca.ET.148.01.1.1]TGU64402.1 P22 coat - protein 5 family protein [Mesorhizobium sp. M2D.F.Ca.ET.147.01.1.1]TGW09978.1 P22 coat - protein 5 family protein [Mesorhizobium sp. M2D.F.Ca.ET.145.01.1.1]